jgi:amino acid permease
LVRRLGLPLDLVIIHSPQQDTMVIHSGEDSPLLAPATSPTESSKTLQNSDESSYGTLDQGATRTVEDHVLPETSTLGRTIGWPSAYIIVISRVIGSGIFATPGVIVKSVGSVGLTLSLWILGAIIAACGLAVTLEYGSMLPRSGGEKGKHSPHLHTL